MSSDSSISSFMYGCYYHAVVMVTHYSHTLALVCVLLWLQLVREAKAEVESRRVDQVSFNRNIQYATYYTMTYRMILLLAGSHLE